MIKRTMEIREVQNGFIIVTTIEKEWPLDNTRPSPLIRKELVVDSLVKLIKGVRAFFESEIVEKPDVAI